MAHSEVEEREQKLQQAEGLNNSIRMELLSSDSERRHLRDTVSHQKRELQQVRHGMEEAHLTHLHCAEIRISIQYTPSYSNN